jgi:hypothetical protein
LPIIKTRKKYPSTLNLIYTKETYIIGIEFIYLYFGAKLHIRCRLKIKAFEGEPQGAAPPPPVSAAKAGRNYLNE